MLQSPSVVSRAEIRCTEMRVCKIFEYRHRPRSSSYLFCRGLVHGTKLDPGLNQIRSGPGVDWQGSCFVWLDQQIPKDTLVRGGTIPCHTH